MCRIHPVLVEQPSVGVLSNFHLLVLLLLRCLQMGKMHFGVLLGWSVVQSIVLWFVVNQIASNEAAEHRALDLYSCCCIVGYGMLPLIVLSMVVLLTPR